MPGDSSEQISPNISILVHVSGPSLAKHDAHYRAQANAYLTSLTTSHWAPAADKAGQSHIRTTLIPQAPIPSSLSPSELQSLTASVPAVVLNPTAPAIAHHIPASASQATTVSASDDASSKPITSGTPAAARWLPEEEDLPGEDAEEVEVIRIRSSFSACSSTDSSQGKSKPCSPRRAVPAPGKENRPVAHSPLPSSPLTSSARAAAVSTLKRKSPALHDSSPAKKRSCPAPSSSDEQSCSTSTAPALLTPPFAYHPPPPPASPITLHPPALTSLLTPSLTLLTTH